MNNSRSNNSPSYLLKSENNTETENLNPSHSITMDTKVDESKPASKIFAVISFYFAVSISLVFLNRTLTSKSGSSEFKGPLFITWTQLVVSQIILLAIGQIPSEKQPSFAKVPNIKWDWDIAIKIFPFTLINLSMILLNNLCLSYVGVALYQIARSLTIAFNVVFTYLILNTKTSAKVQMACFVVFIGFLLGIKGGDEEEEVTFIGIIFGVASSIFVSLNSIYVKKKLPLVNNDHYSLMIYNNAMSIVVGIPLILISGEFTTLFNTKFNNPLGFFSMLLTSGLVGYLINIAVFLQIKYTSPLTSSISGTAKAVLQTALAVLFLGEKMNSRNVLGSFITIGGSAWYAQIRREEGKTIEKQTKRQS